VIEVSNKTIASSVYRSNSMDKGKPWWFDQNRIVLLHGATEPIHIALNEEPQV
jgi:hypothetical protein